MQLEELGALMELQDWGGLATLEELGGLWALEELSGRGEMEELGVLGVLRLTEEVVAGRGPARFFSRMTNVGEGKGMMGRPLARLSCTKV